MSLLTRTITRPVSYTHLDVYKRQTMEIMERLARYTLVGFHVKGYPVTDELLAPLVGLKNIVNFSVENRALTDACFPIFATMPKLRYLLLDGNTAINGSGLSALRDCKIDLLALNHTGLDDDGLLQAASIPKLTHIQIDYTATVSYTRLIHRLLCRNVVVQGNPRVYKALRDQLAVVLNELCRIEAGQGVNDELLDTIQMIATILNGMQEDFAYDR